MSEQRFWFEEVPEEQKYWSLAQRGTPPSVEDKRAAESAQTGISPQEEADLGDIEKDIRSASVSGMSEHEVR